MERPYQEPEVLVTGGTGLLGSSLISLLVSNGIKVRATYRTENSRKNFISYWKIKGPNQAEALFHGIEWVKADLLDIRSLSWAIEGIRDIYHCAGISINDTCSFHKMRKSNTEGTANLVNLALKKGVRKLLHVSSAVTLGVSANKEQIDEQLFWDPNNTDSAYAISKYGAEMEVWRAAAEGLSMVIINPGLILGDFPSGAGASLYLKNAAKALPPGGTGFVMVNDVAKVMYLLMQHDIQNERFVVISENMTSENLKAIRLGFPDVTHLGDQSFSFLKWIPLWNTIFGGSTKVLSKEVIEVITKKLYYSNSKVIQTLGFEFTPINKGLRALIPVSKSD